MRAGPPWRPCGKRMLSRNSSTTSHRDRRSATAVTPALSSSANARATLLPWHSLSGWMPHQLSRKKRRKKRRRNEKPLSQTQNKKNPRWNQKSPLPRKKNRHHHRQKSRSQKHGNGSAENRRSRKNNSRGVRNCPERFVVQRGHHLFTRTFVAISSPSMYDWLCIS
jgi:hypothetical protein